MSTSYSLVTPGLTWLDTTQLPTYVACVVCGRSFSEQDVDTCRIPVQLSSCQHVSGMKCLSVWRKRDIRTGCPGCQCNGKLPTQQDFAPTHALTEQISQQDPINGGVMDVDHPLKSWPIRHDSGNSFGGIQSYGHQSDSESPASSVSFYMQSSGPPFLAPYQTVPCPSYDAPPLDLTLASSNSQQHSHRVDTAPNFVPRVRTDLVSPNQSTPGRDHAGNELMAGTWSGSPAQYYYETEGQRPFDPAARELSHPGGWFTPHQDPGLVYGVHDRHEVSLENFRQ